MSRIDQHYQNHHETTSKTSTGVNEAGIFVGTTKKMVFFGITNEGIE